ncbi:MAG TPA: FAD-dependent oxidoreductase, partial [Acidimicrobiales bacterium]|nr:FAD-dependent oxidoreductase [Acidimicrobiales bacterium]
RLLVIGGDAAGMAGAAQVRRRAAALEIVALEKGTRTSYSACGIPYLVSGAVHDIEDLVARTPEEFRAARIDVRIEHEVVGLDLDTRKAEVHNLAHHRSFHLGFDTLLIATGARPARPGLPGADLPHVHGVQTLDDAARLLDAARERKPKRVAVIGSGYVGLELAEAFLERGSAVTIVEAGPEVMGSLDPEMGALVARALRDRGITVDVGLAARSIDEKAVHTDGADIAADLVILGLGVQPDTQLGAGAGLETGVRDALVVDRQQRTSADGVWAAGDCCQSFHLVSGHPVHQALGTVANKQGRVAGINISGSYATFPGVLGTAVTRVCQTEIGRTGLTETEAADAGYRAAASLIQATTRAGYMPEASPVSVKLVAECRSGRLLGVQIVGGPGSAKRVDVVAAGLAGGLTVEDLLGLDLGYAPPYAPLWDPIQVAARDLVGQL